MKLKFKEDTLKRYSSLDLEYGLTILYAELSDHDQQVEAIKSAGIVSGYRTLRQLEERKVITDKIKIVEDEIITRLLTY